MYIGKNDEINKRRGRVIMNSTLIEINEIKTIWNKLCEETMGLEIERSIAWKLLNSQYRMLLIKKWITDEQIDSFKTTVARFKKMTEGSICA